jgi:hypothetical protein
VWKVDFEMEQIMTRWIAIALFASAGCGGATPAQPPACDQACADGAALRGLRLAMKDGFNRTLQGNDAGMQDEMTPCIGAGNARVHGNIVTNATVGTMDVDLTYDLAACVYLYPADPTPARNFHLTLTGSITEKGTLSAQPTSTTSLIFKSSAMTFSGSVYHPAIDYQQTNCVLDFTQDGNIVAGKVCGRDAGFNF